MRAGSRIRRLAALQKRKKNMVFTMFSALPRIRVWDPARSPPGAPRSLMQGDMPFSGRVGARAGGARIKASL